MEVEDHREREKDPGEGKGEREGEGEDRFQALDDGALFQVLAMLSHPRDLAAAMTVCRRCFALGAERQLWRSLCMRLCSADALNRVIGFQPPPSLALSPSLHPPLPPTLSINRTRPECRQITTLRGGSFFQNMDNASFVRSSSGSGSSSLSSSSSSSSRNSQDVLVEKLRMESQAFAALAWQLVAPPQATENFIRYALHASSTKGYFQDIVQTLLRFRRDITSFWCSEGFDDPEHAETLTYEFESPVCLVHEMMVQAQRASYQRPEPVYASKAVRFRFGYFPSKDCNRTERNGTERHELISARCLDNPSTCFEWTYESPIYPMEMATVLQQFPLPQPVLCIGGIVQVELLGGVQKDSDGLYYIGINKVRAVGRPLPQFQFDLTEDCRQFILQFNGNGGTFQELLVMRQGGGFFDLHVQPESRE